MPSFFFFFKGFPPPVFWYLRKWWGKPLLHNQGPSVLREWNVLWSLIWDVLPGSRILGDRMLGVLEGEGYQRKGEKTQRWGAGAPKTSFPLHKFLKHSPLLWSNKRGKHFQTKSKLSEVKLITTFERCHSVIFCKDSQVELAQELFTTCSVLHTGVIASLNLSMMLGDMPHSPYFWDEKIEAYRTSKWAKASSPPGGLTHRWVHFPTPSCPLDGWGLWNHSGWLFQVGILTFLG